MLFRLQYEDSVFNEEGIFTLSYPQVAKKNHGEEWGFGALMVLGACGFTNEISRQV